MSYFRFTLFFSPLSAESRPCAVECSYQTERAARDAAAYEMAKHSPYIIGYRIDRVTVGGK